MVMTPKSLPVRVPKAPNLPIAPVEYTQRYVDQLLNVLRLYFNEIDNFASAMFTTPGGGAGILFPYGSFYQNGHTTLTAAMTNVSTTPIQVVSTAEYEAAGFLIIEDEVIQYTGKTSTTFTGITRGVKGSTNVAHVIGSDVTEAAGVTAGSSAAIGVDTVISSNGVTVTVPDSKLYFEFSGVYNIQFSAQLLSYDNTDDNVTVWFAKNGTPVDNSASVQQVPRIHGSEPGAIIIALNYVDEFVAGDYVELYWTSLTGNTILATYPPQSSPTRPASPAFILTATFVSALP